MTTSVPDPVDVHVGKRLKLRRTLLGMSQERLGELLGITFQQVQKYERGANRMGSSRLFAIGLILDTPIAWFFEDMKDAPATRGPHPGLGEDRSPFEHAPAQARGAPSNRPDALPAGRFDSRETLELVRAFHRINDTAIRRRLFELAKSLADLPGRGEEVDEAYAKRNVGEWSLPRPPRTS